MTPTLDLGTTLVAVCVCAQVIWVLTFYDEADELYYHRCRDADGNDASLFHPSEVTQWDCEDGDGDYTLLDVVETICDCPTTPSLCSEGDSFYLDAEYTWDDLDTFDGCYSGSGDTFLSDLLVYSRGGDVVDGEPAVIATDNFGTTVS